MAKIDSIYNKIQALQRASSLSNLSHQNLKSKNFSVSYEGEEKFKILMEFLIYGQLDINNFAKTTFSRSKTTMSYKWQANELYMWIGSIWRELSTYTLRYKEYQ